ncbi:MAG: hypothetical protein II567_16355 [Candidatus Riflebacteria bacterium]|nr:hypothetical protein [Candidatus Riflebacteria bacterium]
MANSEINTEQLKKEVKEELLKREIMMGLQEDEIDLFELFAVLKKHWKLIIFFPIIVAVAVAGYSLTMPNYYKSSGTIFVHSSSGGGALSSLMSSIPMAGLMGLGGMGGGGANYLTVYLKSATMSDYIIKRFGIATNPAIVGENYQPDPSKPIIYDNLLKKMDKIVTIDNDAKTGLITISAETMSATTSAEIVSAYIERLDKFSKGPQKEKRIFIEKQLEKIGKELEVAENEYKVFQDKYKLFSLDKQTAASIDKMAQLESQRVNSSISLEMQQSLLKSSGSVPELVKVEAQKVAEEAKAEAIKKEISEVEKELATLPDISLEFIRLQRNLKVKEKLYAVLTEQYEMAKITEAEEGSQFEVMDQARIPELKSKPKRSIMVILAGLSAGVLAVFLAFLQEFVKRRKEQEKQQTEQVA